MPFKNTNRYHKLQKIKGNSMKKYHVASSYRYDILYKFLRISTLIPVFFVIIFVAFSVAKAQENFVITNFDNYVSGLQNNCDFGREFPRNLVDSLSPEPRAACLQLAKDIEAASRLVTRYDTAQPCETQDTMPVNRCYANLKICKEKLMMLRGAVESCRYKIKVDTQRVLKYKTN